ALASTLKDIGLGVFRSDNGGGSWASVGQGFANQGQMSYGNTIAVHPENPDHVIAGGVDLQLTMDGGKTWSHVTKWNAERGKPNYVHADHHCLLMPAAVPGRIYDANDGGMDV